MKKIIALTLTAFMLALTATVSFAGCGANSADPDVVTQTPYESSPDVSSDALSGAEDTQPAESSEPEPADSESGSNILIAYFSWADNAVLAEDVDAVASPSVVPPGNVQQLAGWVQEETGGDLFSIQVTDPYPSDWDECLARANEERGNNTRPELVDQVENLKRYDTVFLGYPNWWYGVPMALLTFLEENDLSGKTVYLFCSHGTGGLARSVELITQAAPQANISDNIFDCYEEETTSSEADIKTWVNELHLEGDNSMEQAQTSRQIAVHFDGGAVVYQLNDSPAADALLAQLPLTVEVEDFSTNEKIFYPPQALDTAGTPLAEGGAGVLAYYAPWGDVVLFYDSFSANGSLFALGKAVSGAEDISQMTGTITVETVE